MPIFKSLTVMWGFFFAFNFFILALWAKKRATIYSRSFILIEFKFFLSYNSNISSYCPFPIAKIAGIFDRS
jgi:hypothetical protein